VARNVRLDSTSLVRFADFLDRGSEVVFELYSGAGQYYIRVLWSGQPMVTSLPLGTLDMIPINDFFNCALPSRSLAVCVLIKCTDINQILGTSGEALFNACQG